MISRCTGRRTRNRASPTSRSQRGPVLVLDPRVELLDQVLLGREVVVRVPDGQARLLGDAAHRGPVVPLLPEQPYRRVDHEPAGLLAPRVRCGRRCRHRSDRSGPAWCPRGPLPPWRPCAGPGAATAGWPAVAPGRGTRPAPTGP